MPQYQIKIHELRVWTEALLRASGVPSEMAAEAADIFLRASLRGVGHHDISYLPQRLDWIANQGVNPTPRLSLVRSKGGIETWDGDRGLGEVCCGHVSRRAAALAREHGIGYAAIRYSNHFLAASPYVERAAEEGLLLLVFSNTDAGMAAPGGVKNIIGNNPIGFALPRAGGELLLLDICMAYSSLGNLKALAAEGRSIPPYWGVDRSGEPTSDPAAVLQGGSAQPMARHKGFGLALLTEVMTGVLAEGPTTDQIRGGGGVNTHNQAVIALDLEVFGGMDAVSGRVEDMAQRLKKAEPGLRIPGERSAAERKKARESGIELPEGLVGSLLDWSKRLSVKRESIPQGIW